MAKLKITDQSLIHVEIEKLQAKVEEFQSYLQMNPIISKITNNGRVRIDEVDLTEDDQDKLHKEIIIQIKMQDALFSWLPALEKLKEKEVDKMQTRGDVQISSLFKDQIK